MEVVPNERAKNHIDFLHHGIALNEPTVPGEESHDSIQSSDAEVDELNSGNNAPRIS